MFVLFYEITFGLGREAHAIGEKMSQSGIVSARSCRTVAADCMGDEALGSFHTQRLAPGADNPFPQGNVRRFPIYPLLTHRNGKPHIPCAYEKTRRECDGFTIWKAGLAAYFCHVRFLCRFDFSLLRRLCFDILSRRFFLRLPMEILNEWSTVRTGFRPVKPEFKPAPPAASPQSLSANA